MIKKIGLTIIADEIKTASQTDILIPSLLSVLPSETEHQQSEPYPKFPDAFKLEFIVPYPESTDKEKIIFLMLNIADTIANPWLIYFDRVGDNTELIFNRDANTRFTRTDFSNIRWAHIQLI